jgi:hypothetical protein
VAGMVDETGGQPVGPVGVMGAVPITCHLHTGDHSRGSLHGGARAWPEASVEIEPSDPLVRPGASSGRVVRGAPACRTVVPSTTSVNE